MKTDLPELVSVLSDHGIEGIHCPVSEEPGASWIESLSVALPKSRLLNTKTNPGRQSSRLICGTPFLQSLSAAVKRYKTGEPIGEGFVVDEVEMKVYDDWKCIGQYYEPDHAPVDLYAPLIQVIGSDETERLMFADEIEGLTVMRGHEYVLKIRRIYLLQRPEYHHYELLEIISDSNLR